MFAVALREAGWDLSQSIPVPDALQAVTGLASIALYDRNINTSVTADIFQDKYLKPVASQNLPFVLQTRNESFHDLKANYAYALYLSSEAFDAVGGNDE